MKGKISSEWDSPRLIEFEVLVKSRTVTALLDCGATHNFISAELITSLDIPSYKAGPLDIMLADGH